MRWREISPLSHRNCANRNSFSPRFQFEFVNHFLELWFIIVDVCRRYCEKASYWLQNKVIDLISMLIKFTLPYLSKLYLYSIRNIYRDAEGLRPSLVIQLLREKQPSPGIRNNNQFFIHVKGLTKQHSKLKLDFLRLELWLISKLIFWSCLSFEPGSWSDHE